MEIISALLILCIAAEYRVLAQNTCQNGRYCPCGRTGKHVIVCSETESGESEPCAKLSKCKTCQHRLNKCLQCEDGLEGPLCISRTLEVKRQFRNYPSSQRWRQLTAQRQSQRYTTVGSVSESPVMYCMNPGPFSNGRFRIISPASGQRSQSGQFSENDEEYPEETQLIYTCDDGFLIQSSDTLRCLETGYWSSEPPTCAEVCGRSSGHVGESPWSVVISVEKNNFTRPICIGSLINSRTVLTAAHCLVGANRFTLYFGKRYRLDQNDDQEVVIRRITRVIIHPDFNDSTLDSDIGLLMFEPKIRFSSRIQPICLPTAESTARNVKARRMGIVAGWGEENQLPSEQLRIARLPVVTNEACIQSYKNLNYTLSLTRNMFCAGFDEGQTIPCRGDAGSSLAFYDFSSMSYTIEGLVSFGAEGQCGRPGTYITFTKVYRFIPWILRNFQ